MIVAHPRPDFRTRVALTALVAAFTMPLLAQPGGGSTFASGIEHDAIGGVSSLSVVGRKLTACCLGSSGQIDDVVANSDAGAGPAVARVKNAKREVVHRKIGVCRNRKPGCHGAKIAIPACCSSLNI